MSELEQDEVVLQKEPGTAASSSAASGSSPSATADSRDDYPQPAMSEADQQKAWKQLGWVVALFLCTSLVFFAVPRDIPAGMCACMAVAMAVAHRRRRWQRGPGGASIEALKAAVPEAGGYAMLTPLVQMLSGTIWLGFACSNTLECPPMQFTLPVHMVYFVAVSAFACGIFHWEFVLFPPPPEKPRDVQLREQALAYQPPSEQSRLEAEELAALEEFNAAYAPDEKAAAHRRWQEVAKKLELLREDPQQYHQLYGQASAEA
ncbi:hypothetical protein COHA_004349 [Chlorella ohadii]|uniref:Uncharacterized protein n=1 Tax=Chlorella ohadii TaxID=2649997 RepID=A0AAD5H6C6_9CHLO|nr:hypothetical protein COHA_004349 [Chlorella ohadii]